MNAEEKILKMLKGNGSSIALQLGEMTSNSSCVIGELKLDQGDLMVNLDISELTKGDIVICYKIDSETNDEKYLILCKVGDL